MPTVHKTSLIDSQSFDKRIAQPQHRDATLKIGLSIMITDQLLISRQTGKVRTRPLLWGPVSPHAARGRLFYGEQLLEQFFGELGALLG